MLNLSFQNYREDNVRPHLIVANIFLENVMCDHGFHHFILEQARRVSKFATYLVDWSGKIREEDRVCTRCGIEAYVRVKAAGFAAMVNHQLPVLQFAVPRQTNRNCRVESVMKVSMRQSNCLGQGTVQRHAWRP